MIYFIQDESTHHIKIGYTSYQNAESRLAALQTGNPSGLTLLLTVEGDARAESELHRRFDSLRVRGEWFAPGAELLMFLMHAKREADRCKAGGDFGTWVGRSLTVATPEEAEDVQGWFGELFELADVLRCDLHHLVTANPLADDHPDKKSEGRLVSLSERLYGHVIDAYKVVSPEEFEGEAEGTVVEVVGSDRRLS